MLVVVIEMRANVQCFLHVRHFLSALCVFVHLLFTVAYEVGNFIIPFIIQMKKLRQREAK